MLQKKSSRWGVIDGIYIAPGSRPVAVFREVWQSCMRALSGISSHARASIAVGVTSLRLPDGSINSVFKHRRGVGRQAAEGSRMLVLLFLAGAKSLLTAAQAVTPDVPPRRLTCRRRRA